MFSRLFVRHLQNKKGRTGGDPNLRDVALLDSALEASFQTFDGQELYPAKEEKGARLGYALIANHA